jgi:Tol biopolymer transport system component
MFSRDGSSLIVNGTAGGTLGVFITDNRGQGPKVILDIDSAYWPVISPDGSHIMYVETALDNKLHRKKIDGESWEVRANDRPILAWNILWTEDNRLVFQGCQTWLGKASKCGIWVTDADSINPVRIIKGLDGWPMDAKHGLLAYMSAEDGDWDIYIIPLEGGEPQNITNNMNQDGLAAIAPDGKSVAYISDESGEWALCTVTLDGGEKRQWFAINPDRGTIDVTSWAGERMSWTAQPD